MAWRSTMDGGLVFLGGGLGATLRWGLSVLAVRLTGSAHAATLLVNVLGCLVMGVLLAWFQTRPHMAWQLLLTTGVLGGLTTFSTFSAEWWQLCLRGAWLAAAGHVGAHVVLSLVAVALGHGLMQRVLAGG